MILHSEIITITYAAQTLKYFLEISLRCLDISGMSLECILDIICVIWENVPMYVPFAL